MQLITNGMGDLVSGVYPIPQNPIMDAVNANAAKLAIVARGKNKGFGDLTPGSYPLPFNPFYSQQMNPVVTGASSMVNPRVMMADTSNALASSVASMTTGPTATLTGFDLSAVTDSLSSITAPLAGDPFGIGVPLWAMGLGAIVVYKMFFASSRVPKSSRYHRTRKALGNAIAG